MSWSTSWSGWNRGAVAAVVLVGLGGGCYDWAAVRPTELPKLNAGAATIEQVDGSAFAVKPPVTAKVATPFGTQKFHQPASRIEGGILTITGDDTPEAHIPLDQIDSIRVGQLNVIDTVTSILLLSGVVVGTVLLFSWIRPVGHSGGVE